MALLLIRLASLGSKVVQVRLIECWKSTVMPAMGFVEDVVKVQDAVMPSVRWLMIMDYFNTFIIALRHEILRHTPAVWCVAQSSDGSGNRVW